MTTKIMEDGDTFGQEIEVLVEVSPELIRQVWSKFPEAAFPLDTSTFYQLWDLKAKEIKAKIEGTGLQNVILQGPEDRTKDKAVEYGNWQITHDNTIDNHKVQEGVYTDHSDHEHKIRWIGVEIKTPIFHYFNDDWRGQIDKVWSVLDSIRMPHVQLYKDCDTHVHYSRKSWSGGESRDVDMKKEGPVMPLRQLQPLAFFAHYIQPAFNDLVVEGWRDSIYSKPNTLVTDVNTGATLPDFSDFQACWNTISGTKSTRELYEMVCWEDSDYRRRENIITKHWKWNFKGLRWQTIEFRQMPPSLNSKDSQIWVDYTVACIRKGMSIDCEALDRCANTAAINQYFGLNKSPHRKEDLEVLFADQGLNDSFWKGLYSRMTALKDLPMPQQNTQKKSDEQRGVL
ncbi:uncharacterized protein BCR38DRAFT_488944 [Pseudomassariella vexata]|uniref:Uncharacterized protein n=1 Tax=Pseudomassariella vexata TaxID=1141098 RepID=A0A1Y2DJ04_9PEZI|nr:uncharacterized protein BCR38DRAFT_488944 [Pseudomassariella vexata]ORY59209.1 hypothetical protein BCR38DRAFT_488944 [Pseudomassariella vexata]